MVEKDIDTVAEKCARMMAAYKPKNEADAMDMCITVSCYMAACGFETDKCSTMGVTIHEVALDVLKDKGKD